MKIVPWDVSIRATSNRSNDLKELKYSKNSLLIVLEEEDTEDLWKIQFENVQAFRFTTEERASKVLMIGPNSGGFYKVLDSTWMTDLGEEHIPFVEKASHYVICCYDEVVEIISDLDPPSIAKA